MRRTFHYDPVSKSLVAGSAPRRGEGSGDGWRYSDRIYSGKPFKAHDGTMIDSKRKHREYMQRHSLTTMDDFKGDWDTASKRRAAVFDGSADRDQRREAIIRAMEKTRGK